MTCECTYVKILSWRCRKPKSFSEMLMQYLGSFITGSLSIQLELIKKKKKVGSKFKNHFTWAKHFLFSEDWKHDETEYNVAVDL